MTAYVLGLLTLPLLLIAGAYLAMLALAFKWSGRPVGRYPFGIVPEGEG